MWLKRFARASKVRNPLRFSLQTIEWRRLATTLAIIALAFGAAAMLGYGADDLSHARYADATQDDGAGAGDTSSTAQVDRHLPSALQDERVIAALAPIA